VTDGDLGHFGQILVEQVGQLLGSQAVGGLREIGDIGVENRQFFPIGGAFRTLEADLK
jgi:hypothetical protein